MRLFLSSQDFGRHAKKVRELMGDNNRVAYIGNAHDYEDWSTKIPSKKAMFEAAGFSFEVFDLRDYFTHKHKIKNDLNKYGMVWCTGGSSFVLRQAMHLSGFDQAITELLAADTIVYGGSSAGACVCAPSLKGIDYPGRARPGLIALNYPSQVIIWQGLDLVPFMIVPHLDQPQRMADYKSALANFDALGVKTWPLKDGQAIIIDGDKTELLQ